MRDRELRRIAVEFVVACISEAEADAYQQQEGQPWYELEPMAGEGDDRGFTVMLAGRLIRFRAALEREKHGP